MNHYIVTLKWTCVFRVIAAKSALYSINLIMYIVVAFLISQILLNKLHDLVSDAFDSCA